jgi:hypothetical protein
MSMFSVRLQEAYIVVIRENQMLKIISDDFKVSSEQLLAFIATLSMIETLATHHYETRDCSESFWMKTRTLKLNKMHFEETVQ